MTANNEVYDRNGTYDILDRILSFEGLYEKVFGKLLDPLVYDRSVDFDIHTIGNVFGYVDAKDIMNRRIERTEFRMLSKILFKFQENPQAQGPR